jgi:hypothetical protein
MIYRTTFKISLRIVTNPCTYICKFPLFIDKGSFQLTPVFQIHFLFVAIASIELNLLKIKILFLKKICIQWFQKIEKELFIILIIIIKHM